MNRATLTALGILGGLLLAAALIWTANPTAIPMVETKVSTKTPTAPPPPVVNSPKPRPAPPQANRARDHNKQPNRTAPPPRPEPNMNPQMDEEAPVDERHGNEVHLVVQAHARWGQILAVLGGTHDPVAMGLRQRIQEMRMEMMAIRRDPENLDFHELEERQRMILSELRQIPSWGPELAKTAARVETVLDAIGKD